MTVQSVGSVTAGFKAVSNQAVPNAATDSFVKVYDNTSKVNNDGQTAKSKQDKTIKKSSDVESSQPAKKTVKDSINADNTVKDEKTEIPAETAEEPDAENLEEALKTLAGIINQITDMLKQYLNIDDNGLADAAAELGLEPSDLLTKEGLQDFFLKMNNASLEDLLADENLLNQLNELKQIAAGLTDDEALNKLANLIGAENPEELLQNPMFREVFNDYLANADLMEDVSEEEPTIEIKDFRNDAFETVSDNSKDEIPDENDLKPVSEKEDNTEKQNSNEKPDFLQVNAFANRLAKAAELKEETGNVRMNTFRDLYDIAGQTIRQIKLNITQETSSLEIRLHPEHLGKVDLQISSKNGIMTAELTAHSESAKRALEAGLEDLKVSLEQTGLKVENVEVTLAEFGFRQRDDRETGEGRKGGHQGRRRAFGISSDDSDLQKEFKEVSDIMKELNGNSVDYTA